MTHFRQERLKKEEIEKWKLGKLTTDGVTEKQNIARILYLINDAKVYGLAKQQMNQRMVYLGRDDFMSRNSLKHYWTWIKRP